jgi:hypothetical protein
MSVTEIPLQWSKSYKTLRHDFRNRTKESAMIYEITSKNLLRFTKLHITHCHDFRNCTKNSRNRDEFFPLIWDIVANSPVRFRKWWLLFRVISRIVAECFVQFLKS